MGAGRGGGCDGVRGRGGRPLTPDAPGGAPGCRVASATPVSGAGTGQWQRKRCSLVRWRSRADAQHSARNAARFRVSSTFPDDGDGPADGDRARRFRGSRPPRVRNPRRTGAGWSSCWCRRSSDDVMRNALARVSGELAAAPFKTITAPIDPDGDVMAQVETRRERPGGHRRVRDRARPRSRLAARDDLGIEPSQRHDDHAAHAGRGRQRRSGRRAAGRRDGRARARQPGRAVAVAAGSVDRAAGDRRERRRPAPGRGSRWRSASGWFAISATRPTSGRRRSRRRTAVRRPRRAPVGERARPRRRRLGDMGSARIERAMATLGLVRSFRADRIVQPTIGIGGRRAAPVRARHAPATPEQAADDRRVLGAGHGERRPGAGARPRASRSSSRRTADVLAAGQTCASATPTWRRSIVRPCSRMRGCLRPSRRIRCGHRGVAIAGAARAAARRTCWSPSIPPPVPTAAWSAPRRAARQPARRLVGCWRLDDGTGSTIARDSSRTRNDGTLVDLDPATAWVGGRSAGGLAVEGAGFVNVPPSPSIDSITDQVTIAGWGYLEGTIDDYATIASREDGTTIDQHYHISINSRGEVPALWLKTENGTHGCCRDRQPSRGRPGSTSPAPTTGRRPACTSTASRWPARPSPAASWRTRRLSSSAATATAWATPTSPNASRARSTRSCSTGARSAPPISRSSTTACCFRRPLPDQDARRA